MPPAKSRAKERPFHHESPRFFAGAKVRVSGWTSLAAGYVSGRIIRIHTHDTLYKGHPRHASKQEPQYEIQSDKTDHIAMHKGAVLHKID